MTISRQRNRFPAYDLPNKLTQPKTNHVGAVSRDHSVLLGYKLQRVLNSAARVVSGTRKFDRGLRQLMHTELHWLDVPERVKYKLGVITRSMASFQQNLGGRPLPSHLLP